MRKNIAVLAIVLCVTGTSTAFARGYHHGNHSGYYYGSHYYGYRGSGHHNNGLGIAVGVMGGLLLGSALVYSAAPPPPTVVYAPPYTAYQPPVVVQQPKVCVEDQVVNGQWQINKDGSQTWVPFAYPVTQKVQVPCY